MDQTQQKALNALEPFILLSKSATSPRAAADLVKQATSSPNTFVFAELLQTPNIQALAAAPPEYASYFTLLQIFAWGTWADYQCTFPTISSSSLVITPSTVAAEQRLLTRLGMKSTASQLPLTLRTPTNQTPAAYPPLPRLYAPASDLCSPSHNAFSPFPTRPRITCRLLDLLGFTSRATQSAIPAPRHKFRRPLTRPAPRVCSADGEHA